METITSADGTTIAFDRLGSGPPLVLVSGASCDRSADAPIAAALGRHFTVLTYDRRGRGDSTDTAPFAVEREIEDIAALLETADGGAVLVGQSSGAVLAARATAAGLPVRALVMWEPPFAADEDAASRAARYTRDLTARLAEDDRDGALELFMRQVGIPEEVIGGIRQSPHWAKGVGLAPTLAYDNAAMGDGRVPVEVCRAVAVPALVLAGGASPEWFRTVAVETARHLPHGSTAVLDGQTHAVDGEVLAEAVTQFARP